MNAAPLAAPAALPCADCSGEPVVDFHGNHAVCGTCSGSGVALCRACLSKPANVATQLDESGDPTCESCVVAATVDDEVSDFVTADTLRPEALSTIPAPVEVDDSELRIAALQTSIGIIEDVRREGGDLRQALRLGRAIVRATAVTL